MTAAITVAAAGELADPTMPPSHAAAGPVAAMPRLQAIIHTQAGEFAVVDGRRVVPGDRVGAWQIVEIGGGSVRLREGGRELELRLAAEIRRAVIPRGGRP
ncbi:MAG: MSHA biogenesis protein MshK [Myxococcota bacterium]